MNAIGKAVRGAALLAMTGLASVGTAIAQNADVGLLNMLNGDVNYASEGGSAGSRAQAFMKVR